MNEALSDSLSERRLSVEMVASFAVTALLLAGFGIYGTISYIVSERRREIGIRLALGAQREEILAMVLGQGLGLAITGATVGLVGALIVLPDARASLRRETDRSLDVRGGYPRADSRGVGGLLYSREARDAGRSPRRAALRVARLVASVGTCFARCAVTPWDLGKPPLQALQRT